MERAYFNHSRLIGAGDRDLNAAILEIHHLKDSLKSIPLYVYEGFWGLPVKSGSLQTFFSRRDKRESAYILILDLMHNGPHFPDRPYMENLVITPGVDADCFGKKLLHICYQERQEHIISLDGERDLAAPHYTLSKDSELSGIFNLIGKEKLLGYLGERVSFDNIESVFKEIERGYGDIVILPSARKSAQKHNFKGAYHNVYKTIVALQSEMTRLLENEPDRLRIKAFLDRTGFEISPESSDLPKKLKDRRMFPISSMGRQYFEWHIKIGKETRIHYFIDQENRKIFIGHCGKHLPVPSWNS